MDLSFSSWNISRSKPILSRIWRRWKHLYWWFHWAFVWFVCSIRWTWGKTSRWICCAEITSQFGDNSQKWQSNQSRRCTQGTLVMLLWCYCYVIVMLLWCYCDVIVMLLLCYCDVIVMLLWCYCDVIVMLLELSQYEASQFLNVLYFGCYIVLVINVVILVFFFFY